MDKQRKKILAVRLRKGGESYSQICKQLKLSKSTVSDWVKNIEYSPNSKTLLRIKNGPIRSGIIRHHKMSESINLILSHAKNEVGAISKRDLYMLGIGIYLGEGSKTIESVRVTNSDPRVIKISIIWLKKIIGLSECNLGLALHTYPDNNIEEDIDYWSKITGISKNNFGKTQIDKRAGKLIGHKLPHGTVQLRVVANGEKRFGVSLHRRIMGWIDAVSNQVTSLV